MSKILEEGELYPELRRARWYPLEMTERHIDATSWVKANYSPDQMVEHKRIRGVRLELPEEDLNAILEIYRAHYHAASKNPAVREAWREYQLLLALTEDYQ